VAEATSVALLALSLAVVTARPQGLAAGTVAAGAAAALLGAGTVPRGAALRTLRELAPTVAFLATILVLGHLAQEYGVFDYLGGLAARRSDGRPRRLLLLVVVLASVVTAVLTLDATVVLLTPVVVQTTRRLEVPSRPHVYACAQLANAGSLLLPVSNLTNLLALRAADVSFGRFAVVMAAPWLAATALEWLGLRLFFRADLPEMRHAVAPAPAAPRYALAVLALTVLGFAAASAVGVPPVWPAVAGAVALSVPRLVRRETSLARLVRVANVGFCVFVFGLGVIVDAVTRHGLGHLLGEVTPAGSSLMALLGMAAVAGLLANVLNNLPATLALLPLAGSPAAVLAVLVGVNVGPNATYPGSLATLLWRRVLPSELRPNASEFHRYGLLTVPIVLVLSVVLLWAAARAVGLR
jgi:arsenical pump membrane protein